MKKIPNVDFEAFVRPNISTYYRHADIDPVGSDSSSGAIFDELEPDFVGVSGKFVNMSPCPTSLWWTSESDGVSSIEDPILMGGRIEGWGSGGTTTYPNHVFILTKYLKPKNIICGFTVQPRICVYYCDPYVNQLDE
jgi:hypothetical protein